MRLVSNRGSDRLVDLVRLGLEPEGRLDVATSEFSVFAYGELREELSKLDVARVLLPSADADLDLLGGVTDRAGRNRLETRRLAASCADWLARRGHIRHAGGSIPQGTLILRDAAGRARHAALGSLDFTTAGLGMSPGNPLNIVQTADTSLESEALATWFETMWARTSEPGDYEFTLVDRLRALGAYRDPARIYHLMLHHLFSASGGELDEDDVVDAATGIRDTVVWNKLYRFQRDGVIGAIDKLNRYGGCIIADSVGLGKTFEALAVIKYHELRNDRVLVLCPKRLRDNWTMYAANDKRNVLAADRFNYDVLNHTDLSREQGMSGDIDLSYVNWGNYDLVVIDESHNFRNAKSPKKGGETRYDRLMRQIVKEGVKTRVLMLSATPVNNRLADLRNQIAFATENEDTGLSPFGISSISETTRKAQRQFNKWQDLAPVDRTPARLVDMLGFDYFALLDMLTIARSRKHVEKYYGTSETGRFPERRTPINIKADIDTHGDFRSIKDLNDEIRRLNLAAYSPMQYVLPHKRAEYDERYSTRLSSGKGSFQQADRELSLVNLLRVNILKRLESSVESFRLTVSRQLADVERRLAAIERNDSAVSDLSIADIEIDDTRYEDLLIGAKVKVLITDMDLIKWRQDLTQDRDRLAGMLDAADKVSVERDAKLAQLREMITGKVRGPINTGNRKIIVFTAFADTAKYLYEQLADWARSELGIESGLVTGSGSNRTTLPKLRRDLSSILSTFSPRSKQRPDELAGEGELDLLIATDCISEGQNLQDCDWLVNFDIHWNPVRIIQRFGRIDRLGSTNDTIQLVNFWPQMDLEEYINLEQRVSGRMVLLDISATGEENVIRSESGDPMNDLEYRRTQLLKLQDSVLDLEDLSTGVSIADLTLTDLRIELADYAKSHPGVLEEEPLGVHAVTEADLSGDVPPGLIFCLRAEGRAAERAEQSGDPLAPYYVVHVGNDGALLLKHTQAKRVLDRLRRAGAGQNTADPTSCARYDAATRKGADMRTARKALAAAVRSITGREEERAVASLFSLDGTQATAGEFAGVDDFEVMAFLVILPADGRQAAA
ncbi:helicase-related protein [Kitasatospora sp. CMC57]|uniref:Helicase-related protein n=1 Tax=Kitasatospora sp. CMC57 TaxID=3231513 RepID=A0AB33JUD9_9ACTN